ncbi:MAG TPA: universal stress protein [Solirubrobacteraceae bacterium]|jgi:nucleotide-binding universal stress UspA family protein|nr:universal stress protein [Solirubrobacteraceae bacterium]
MTPLAVVLIVVALAAGFGAAVGLERWRRERALRGTERVRRIAFPFTGEGLSEPALAAALRLARAEGATLMPVYLALVPLRLSVEVPLRSECDVALPMLETIERRAARAEVPVDSRIERGRTVRHALRELAAHERFDRIVVAAGADSSGEGFTPEAVAWLLTNVPGEVIVLRPASAAPQAALQPEVAAPQASLQPGEAAPPQPSSP